MIDITQPAIALNDSRTRCNYLMQESRSILPSFKRQQIVDLVADFALNKSTDHSLFDLDGELVIPKDVVGKVNVVINCHGSPGHLLLGEGIGRNDVQLFARWRGLVEKIWIVACKAAYIKSKGSNTDGNIFCSELAKHAECYVVAGTETQWFRTSYPFGKIDSFEGLVLSYGPNGDVTWSHRYPSSWKANRE